MADEKQPAAKPVESPKPLPHKPDPGLVQVFEKGANGPKETRRG